MCLSSDWMQMLLNNCIWSQLLKKFSIENLIFCAVLVHIVFVSQKQRTEKKSFTFIIIIKSSGSKQVLMQFAIYIIAKVNNIVNAPLMPKKFFLFPCAISNNDCYNFNIFRTTERIARILREK